MPHDAAALGYGERVVRELKDAGGYDDPSLRMIVKNADGTTLFVIPFSGGHQAGIVKSE